MQHALQTHPSARPIRVPVIFRAADQSPREDFHICRAITCPADTPGRVAPRSGTLPPKISTLFAQYPHGTSRCGRAFAAKWPPLQSSIRL